MLIDRGLNSSLASPCRSRFAPALGYSRCRRPWLWIDHLATPRSQWSTGAIFDWRRGRRVFLLPFLAGLSAATGHMQIEFVREAARTPVAQFLIVYWPLILLRFAVPGRVYNPLAGSSPQSFWRL